MWNFSLTFSRFSNLLTVLAYIDICYVTIELAHISIVLFARVSLLIFVSSWTLFWTGLPWKRCGHILFGFVSPFLPPHAPSISDCYGTSHCHIQVTEERWTVNLHALLQPGQIHCSVPPLPSLHRPGLIVHRTSWYFKTIKQYQSYHTAVRALVWKMALYYEKSILTEISAFRQDSKIIRIKGAGSFHIHRKRW